jgi:hypothetical protein
MRDGACADKPVPYLAASGNFYVNLVRPLALQTAGWWFLGHRFPFLRCAEDFRF